MIVLCENCKQNEATVYVSEVVNGQKTEHYLCDHCVKAAQQETGQEAILFNNFISELMKIALEEGYLKSPKQPSQKRCSCCDLSLKEFLEIGRFGCKECYSTFNNELKNAFINVHGNTKHVGKVLGIDEQADAALAVSEQTKSINIAEQREKQLNELQGRLEEAVESEAYEEAARIRDIIRALKKEGTN